MRNYPKARCAHSKKAERSLFGVPANFAYFRVVRGRFGLFLFVTSGCLSTRKLILLVLGGDQIGSFGLLGLIRRLGRAKLKWVTSHLRPISRDWTTREVLWCDHSYPFQSSVCFSTPCFHQPKSVSLAAWNFGDLPVSPAPGLPADFRSIPPGVHTIVYYFLKGLLAPLLVQLLAPYYFHSFTGLFQVTFYNRLFLFLSYSLLLSIHYWNFWVLFASYPILIAYCPRIGVSNWPLRQPVPL